MANVKNKTRKIPLKNYVIAIAVFIGVILLTLYLAKWYQLFNDEKITKSYLVSNNVIANEINDISELEDVLSEAPDEYFIYISYTNDKDVYNMEMDLKKVIKKYDLEDEFYYLNVDLSKQTRKEIIDDLNSSLDLKNEKITSIPTIVYFKNNELVKGGIIHKDENTLMQASDFEQLLEVLEVEKK